MDFFGRFYLDKEKDIIVDLYRGGQDLHYILQTPNHNSGNLITNLAKLCELPISYDMNGLKVIRGVIPCYVDGNNRRLFIFRMGNTKIANIYPDGSIEMKASIPAISKVLMSQTKDYRLSITKTIVKTYIFDDCKFHTDLHTHMNGNLDPDVLIALGVHHQIRYPLYYIKKLNLKISPSQHSMLESARQDAAKSFRDSVLSGKYLDRKIDDNTFLNFADLILNNPEYAAYNISKIRTSLSVPKDGQAVFADLEKVYLYRYVFTKGIPSSYRIAVPEFPEIPDKDISAALEQMQIDRKNPEYRDNTLFQDKLLWIARRYQRYGVCYAEISDTSLVKKESAAEVLRQIHQVMPAVQRETGVLLRFLCAIRRTPLTIVKDSITPNDYLAENLQVLQAVANDPYIAGSDIVGEEINDILNLRSAIGELVKISEKEPGFVIRIHAGENDSLRDNVANSIQCIRDALSPGQPMPCVRIGHGLYTSNLKSSHGQKLIRDLRESGAVLEFQITSNVRLNNLSNLKQHPLKQYLQAGICCVQGTDGGALYGTNTIDEELALERMLELSHQELCQMRRAEDSILKSSFETFQKKQDVFPSVLNGDSVGEYYSHRIRETGVITSALWDKDDRISAMECLRDQIADLPEGKYPIILAGGSFNSDRHTTRVRETGKEIINELLARCNPDKVYFVIGHKLNGYERYLVRNNFRRFQIYSIVPSMISRLESIRLQNSKTAVRISIEPSGNGLYKSFAYEIFKRMPSILLAFDGNSPAANLVQEAKNGRFKCRIFLDSHSKALYAKGKTLQGYVQMFRSWDDLKDLLAEEGLFLTK